MVYNLKKMSSRNLLASIFILSFVLSSLLPFFSNRVVAQIPVTDIAHITVTAADAKRSALRDALDMGARIAAQVAIERIVSSTVTWAQSGFEGNPAYVTDPKGYFGNIADGVAGEFIMGSDLGFLCSPFQANIRVSLTQQYYKPRPFQCTITGITGNIEDFYTDFSSGGWDTWFSMTQTPTNNPYGAYLEAKIEMDSRIASAVGLQREQLNWNQGFLSWSECIKSDPNTGECLERGPTKTPGSVIKSNLDRVLPAGLERLTNVQHFDQLIEAFATGILKRYVFGSDGLFSTTGEAVPSLIQPGGGGGGTHFCPVPTTDSSYCQGVDSNGVLSILNGYPATNDGITAALPEIQSAYGGHVQILDHPERLDKLDFGGGMIVDVVIGAGGPDPSWGWIVECNCGSTGGETVGEPPTSSNPTPTPQPPTTTFPTFVSPPNNEIDTVNSIASGSAEWQGCLAGSGVACHRFVREVAEELASQDPRWGLLTKNPGEQQCTLTECGGLGGEGYGEDIVVYRMSDSTTSNLYIVDIVAGAGGTNPSTAWIAPQPQRSGNNWAPVP